MTLSNDKPQTDVSQRALRIARKIDRLPEGTYLIELEKVNDKAVDWNYRQMRVVGMDESKIRPDAPAPKVDTEN